MGEGLRLCGNFISRDKREVISTTEFLASGSSDMEKPEQVLDWDSIHVAEHDNTSRMYLQSMS